jgi:hypothetical protein
MMTSLGAAEKQVRASIYRRMEGDTMKGHPILNGLLLATGVAVSIFATRALTKTIAVGANKKVERRTSNLSTVPMPPTNPMTDVPVHPTEEEIAALAQHYWEEEGQPDGKALEHWQRAESELHHRLLEQSAADSANASPPTVLGIS